MWNTHGETAYGVYFNHWLYSMKYVLVGKCIVLVYSWKSLIGISNAVYAMCCKIGMSMGVMKYVWVLFQILSYDIDYPSRVMTDLYV